MKSNRIHFFTLILFLSASASLSSQVLYDTVSVRSVGPGMVHYHVIAPAIPWNIDVLQVHLRNPYVSLETVKANDRLVGYETVSSMAARKRGPGRVVVGAINGDFYGGSGIPTNIQIAQGEILLRPVTRPAIGFTAKNAPVISVVSMAVTALIGDTIATVHGVNATRQTNQMILFNSFNGSTTGTNQSGTEVLTRPITPWIVNDTVVCVAESLEVGVGNMTIPRGWAVLSAHGTSATAVLSKVHRGDTLRLIQSITPGLRRIKEMVGGNPKLVSGGIDVSYAAPREPRTAAGFSADSTTLYLVTVDGRQPASVGMTFEELARFMIQIGVHEGINLDGGGSTTMVLRDSVMNSPSDGGERAVSNGLLVISSAPTGSLLTVSISPKNTRIFRGISRQFRVFGADEFGNPSTIDPALVRFSCDPRIGTIDSLTGLFVAVNSASEGMVTLRYATYSDSARVVVKPLGTLHLSPINIVTDTTRTISFNVVSYDIDNLRQNIPQDAYHWTSTNPAVGVVSDLGVFKGLAVGTTNVIVSLDGLTDTAVVRVEVGEGQTILDPFESLSGWTATAVQVDSFFVTLVDSGSSAGSSSVRINYRFTGSANVISYVYLDAHIPVFGVPDSVIIDARTDNHIHRIYYVAEDDNGEQFRLYSSKLLNQVGVWETIRSPLIPNQAITSGAVFNFPIVIKRIEVQLVYNRQAGVSYSGTLFLDNLHVSYPKKVITAIEFSNRMVPTDFRLDQNYPNPFNPTTSLEFSVPAFETSAGSVRRFVSLKVYDILGREVATVVNELLMPGHYNVKFDATDLSSGTYFYVLSAGAHRLTRKMLLLR